MLIGIFALSPNVALAAQANITEQRTRAHYEFPAQALKTSLIKLAKSAKLRLIYKSSTIEGLQNIALSGDFTIEEVLKTLLSGNSLSFQIVRNRYIAITRVSNVENPEGTTNDAFTNNDDEVVFIPEILVVGETHFARCCGDSPSAATKTIMPTIDIPRSLEGIDQQLFSDRSNALLREAFRDFTSVLILDEQANLNLRGFNVPNSAILIDGIPTISSGVMSSPLQNIAGIEVVKGANSALYGHGEPGGLVNLITKKPTDTKFTHLSASYGDYDHFIAIDTNNPKTLVEGLQYRLNAIFRKEVDNGTLEGKAEQIQVHPAIEYEIDDSKKILLTFNYEKQEVLDRDGLLPYRFDRFSYGWLYPQNIIDEADALTQRIDGVDFFPTGGANFDSTRDSEIYGLRLHFDAIINKDWKQSWAVSLSRSDQNSNYRASFNPYTHFLFDGYPGTPYETLVNSYAASRNNEGANIFLVDQLHEHLDAKYPDFSPANQLDWIGVVSNTDVDMPYWRDDNIHQYQQDLIDDNRTTLANLQWNLSGDLSWGNTQHHLLLGLSYSRAHDEFRTDQRFSNELSALGLATEQSGHYEDVVLGWALRRTAIMPWFDPLATSSSPNIIVPDVFAEQAGIPQQSEYALDGRFNYYTEDLKTRTTGIYLMDHIELNEQWRILVSGGWYQFKRERKFYIVNRGAFMIGEPLNVSTENVSDDHAFAPTAGIVYLAHEDLSFYANYGKQFNIRTDRKSDLSIFDPEETATFEVGTKWWLTPDLLLNLATFQLTKENWAVRDETHQNYLSQEGRLRSQGAEINFSGFLTANLKIASNYAEHSLKSLSSHSQEENLLLDAKEGVPDNSGSLWLQYYVEPYGHQGLSVGIGHSYIGKRIIDPPALTINIPSVTLYDAVIAYQTADFRVALNIDNLADTEWLTGKRSDPTNVLFLNSPHIFQGYGRRYRAAIQWYF